MILDDEAYQQATVEDPYEQLFLDETTPEPSHFADDESSDLSDTESEEKCLGTRDKNYVIVEDDDDNYESQEEKGPKKFHYYADLEIVNDITPKICLKRKL